MSATTTPEFRLSCALYGCAGLVALVLGGLLYLWMVSHGY